MNQKDLDVWKIAILPEKKASNFGFIRMECDFFIE